MKIGPESQSISHRDQRQPIADTEKPDMIGPRAGPQVADKAHSPSTYGSLMRLNMSPKEAPPVAKQGCGTVSNTLHLYTFSMIPLTEPKNPCKNLITNNPATLSTSGAAMQSATKMPMVSI